MHSLPSRRRLPQPNFFRFKCYRLSPFPFSLPPPPPPPLPAASLPRLLPATHLPPDTPPPFSAHAALTHNTLTPGAVCRQQARRPPSAGRQTRPHTPGTVQQADAQQLHGAVGRQGCRTLSQSAIRDSVIAVHVTDPAHLSFPQSHEDHLHHP